MSETDLLVIDDVHKRFGGLSVLSGVSVSVRAGERHAVIGPNGAGKSTLFNMISGQLAPTAGRILLKGQNIAGLPPHRIARMGVGRSFQIINLFPNLSVFEIVRCAVLSQRGRRFDVLSDIDSIADVTSDTETLIASIGLQDRRDTVAQSLAYGEQRRLEILLTVVIGRDIVLLDEPCAGLNADDTRAAIEMIRRVTQGRTLVMVEHDMDVVFGLADRITVVYYGKVLVTGTPSEIRADVRVQEAYLGRRANAARA